MDEIIEFVNYGDEVYWEDGIIVQVAPEEMDRYGWESLLHSLSQSQLEVLVCRYLGMSPTQIVKALELKNIGKYYSINVKIKDSYRKTKDHFIG